ncbi:MAG: gamma-glutamyl-gamma-aminobutyrate hydrolase family protein [Bacillota bacterium]
MKPTIGITTNFIDCHKINKTRKCGVNGQDMLMSTVDYSNAIAKAGGIPLLIPISKINKSDLKYYIEKLDGIIFSGGHDIHPRFYDEKIQFKNVEPIIKRDIFEMKLLELAINKNIPVLGICRGLQLINVYLNGSLYQDLKKQTDITIDHKGSIKKKNKKVHTVKLEKQLKNIFKNDVIKVNSVHHQAIKDLGDNLEILAKADKLIESIKVKNKPILAIQWHPEMLYETDRIHLELFKYLIKLSS